ncbi:hypothetical protein FCULG_00008994, partial [Fusarium culmorum]
PTLEEELNLPIETGDKDEEEITPTHPNSHKDKVTKLKHKLQELGKRYNNLLNAAKFNSKVAKNKIKELKGKLYKEHIEHTAALTATGKDLGEILKPRQPDPYEPIIQDFIINLLNKQAEITKYIYKKYKYFKSELINAFGMINKKREAEIKIHKLIQKGSAASYLSEYQY